MPTSSTISDIPDSAKIARTAIIGASFRPLLEGADKHVEPTIIGENVWVGEYCIVGRGAQIGANTIIDHYCHIESDAIIGESVLIIYRAQVCTEAQIATGSIIGGFIGERTRIGSHCRIFGSLVHHHVDPSLPWDAEDSGEEGAIVFDDVFIGFGANVTRPVTLGPKSYICAGALVSKPVPPLHIAFGTNQIVHRDKWKGELRNSPFLCD